MSHVSCSSKFGRTGEKALFEAWVAEMVGLGTAFPCVPSHPL